MRKRRKHKVAVFGMTSVVQKKAKTRRFEVDLTMDWTDAAVLGVAPTDDNGNATPVDSVTWNSSALEVTIEPSTNGLKAYAVPSDNFLGVAVVTADVDVDLGDGVETIQAVWNITVADPKATQLNPSAT